MTRAAISLPSRLQLLSFFLVVENVVKAVIARLEEPATPPSSERPTKDDLDDIREAISDIFDDVSMLRDDFDKQKHDAAVLLTLAALNKPSAPVAPFVPPLVPFAPIPKPAATSSSLFSSIVGRSPESDALEAALAELSRKTAAPTRTPSPDEAK